MKIRKLPAPLVPLMSFHLHDVLQIYGLCSVSLPTSSELVESTSLHTIELKLPSPNQVSSLLSIKMFLRPSIFKFFYIFYFKINPVFYFNMSHLWFWFFLIEAFLFSCHLFIYFASPTSLFLWCPTYFIFKHLRYSGKRFWLSA